jgi:hypothetical protein
VRTLVSAVFSILVLTQLSIVDAFSSEYGISCRLGELRIPRCRNHWKCQKTVECQPRRGPEQLIVPGIVREAVWLALKISAPRSQPPALSATH